jgi:hypothetical protein
MVLAIGHLSNWFVALRLSAPNLAKNNASILYYNDIYKTNNYMSIKKYDRPSLRPGGRGFPKTAGAGGHQVV